jgi:hypothetical protein
MRTTVVEIVLRGLHRRFWIVGAATVAVCAALAAQAAGHVVEARYLPDARQATPLPPAAVAPAPPPLAPPVRDPVQLVERNMFCSDCAGAGDPGPGPLPTGEGVPLTSLPLALIATSLGTQPWATVKDTTSGAQGAFGVGDRIPRAGVIAQVAGTWIDFHNETSDRIERVRLLTGPGDGPAKPLATAARTPATPATPFADRVRKIDDTTYEVDRGLVRELVSGGKVDGVRVIPLAKGDKLTGIKVVMARSTSVAAAIGLKPGDVIEAIDGVRIESAQQMIDMLARLNDITSVRFEGTRKGAPLALALQLR